MKKITCGQCGNKDDLSESQWPIRTRAGRVKTISTLLCGSCRRQAQVIIARAFRQGTIAV